MISIFFSKNPRNKSRLQIPHQNTRSKAHISSTKGFTLIELLVVISIIGMLSSVVLVSLNGARDKGKIAASITFARHSYTKLYLDTLFDVNFNEPDGTAPKDYSGNYTTTVTGIIRDSSTPLSDSGKSFDSTTLTNLIFNKPTATALSNSYRTISIWFKKTGSLTTTRGYVAEIFGYHVYLDNLGKFNCYQGGATALINTSVIDDGKWHHILCTNDGGTVPINMYVDGKLANTSSSMITGPDVSTLQTTQYIGRHDTDTTWRFPGLIDNVQAFYQSLTASEVGQLYAQGLPEHTVADAR